MRRKKLRVGTYTGKCGSVIIHEIRNNEIVVYSIADVCYRSVATYDQIRNKIEKFNLSYVYKEAGWD